MATPAQLENPVLTKEQLELRARIQKAFVEAMFFRIPYPKELPDPFEWWNEYDLYEI